MEPKRLPEWIPAALVAVCLALVGYLIAGRDDRRAYVDGKLARLEERVRILEVAHGPNPHPAPVRIEALGGP